jgi:hypothetical protein
METQVLICSHVLFGYFFFAAEDFYSLSSYLGSALLSMGLFLGGSAVELNRLSVLSRVWNIGKVMNSFQTSLQAPE